MAAMGRIPDRLKENDFKLMIVSHDYIVPLLFRGMCPRREKNHKGVPSYC